MKILKAVLAGSTALLAHATPMSAQVIEIDSDGQSTVYAGPTLFSAEETPAAAVSQAVARRVTAISAAIPSLDEVEQEIGLEKGLLHAVMYQESRGNMGAISPKGALGWMQLMPGTAAELGVDPRDPDQNLRGGAVYLKRQIDRFGSIPLALAAYNAGPNAVARYGGIPPYRETQNYVSSIMSRFLPGGSLLRPLAASDSRPPVSRLSAHSFLIEVPDQ